MGGFAWRRLGAVFFVAVLLCVSLVPAAAASSLDATAGVERASSTIHYVRRGETLFSIARQYGVDAYAIARANKITNMNRIYVGQALVIPGGTTPPPQGGAVYYTVLRGDNLTLIARRYGTTVYNLMKLNNISNPDRIYPGQVLLIRRGTTPTPPPPPPPPPPPGGTWLGTYYNNRDLAGSPVLERRDANIDFNWGFGTPNPSVVPADNFSVRWTRTFNMAGGTYRLTARSDDGIRVYIDGVKIIEDWSVHPVQTYVQDYVITSGNHTFTVEFFEAEGLAEVFVTSQKLY